MRGNFRRLPPILVTFAVLLGSAGEGWSADYQKGLGAYNRGEYATTLGEWKPLAKQGNAGAQFRLGDMYHQGEGVPQNHKTAVKWYRLAVEQGEADAQHFVKCLEEKIAE